MGRNLKPLFIFDLLVSDDKVGADALHSCAR